VQYNYAVNEILDTAHVYVALGLSYIASLINQTLISAQGVYHLQYKNIVIGENFEKFWKE